MTPPPITLAEASVMNWHSIMPSTTCGVLGAAAVVTALVVFARKRGQSGWKTIVVLAFGVLLVAVPVLHNFSLSWTADGKPVVNFSLNAVIAAVNEAKEEAKNAVAEAQKFTVQVVVSKQALRSTPEQVLAANQSIGQMSAQVSNLGQNAATLAEIKSVCESLKSSGDKGWDSWRDIAILHEDKDASSNARAIGWQKPEEACKKLFANKGGQLGREEFKLPPLVPLIPTLFKKTAQIANTKYAMPFDPTKPANSTNASSAEMWAQLTALHTDMQSRALQSTLGSLHATMAVNLAAIQTFAVQGASCGDANDQQLAAKMEELILALLRRV